MEDVIIIGGGPAGLSTALVLARCRRRVLVIDDGRPRNGPSQSMHNYLTRDGIGPHEFLRLACDEVIGLGAVVVHGRAVDACQGEAGFEVTLEDGSRYRARKLVIATGLRDELPEIEGIGALYGTSVHHCPYCDAHKWCDRTIAALGEDRKGLGLALSLLTWTDRVVLLTNGVGELDRADREQLDAHGIEFEPRPLAALEGRDGLLERVRFDDGGALPCDALFFNTSQDQTCDLAVRLGCRLDDDNGICIDDRERTGVPGLFVVGDASSNVEFVIVAAAEGATAGVTINLELQEEAGRVAVAR